MSFAQRRDFTVFRKDPLHVVFGVIGFDLTGATMSFCVRLKPDTPGDPLMALANQATQGADGIRVVDIDVDADGVPTSLIEMIWAKANIQALPAALELGADVTLACDFQWTLPDDGSGLTSLEETVLFGDFVVKGSVNG